MVYARVIDGVIEYPFTDTMLRKSLPNTSLPEFITDGIRKEFNVYPLDTTPPSFDHDLEFLTENPVTEWNLVDDLVIVTYTVNQFPAEHLVAFKESALREITNFFDTFVSTMIKEVPKAEQDSWIIKEQIAAHYVNQTITVEDLALLQMEATIVGETVADLAAQILALASTYRVISFQISGFRRKAAASINAALTPSAITDIKNGIISEFNATLIQG